MLLRIAIGWHFLYEGLDKFKVNEGGKTFSAEGYLRGSAGPFASHFRNLVPDVDSLGKLDLDTLKKSWHTRADQIAAHYGYDGAQRARLDAELKDTEAKADDWFQAKENAEKGKKYKSDLGKVLAIEANPGSMSYERERAASSRKDLDKDRRELVAPLDAMGGALEDAIVKLATPEQAKAVAPFAPPPTQVDQINLTTKYAMVIFGTCMILGLFTPVAALGLVWFLAMFYFSLPPWPGVPSPPNSEGHYWIVNKNLIELLACLVVASTPSGLWVGLDALIFGRFARRRAMRAAERRAERDLASSV
ncbi:DoxX family protein [Isosphaeraceae bacterium EP7]